MSQKFVQLFPEIETKFYTTLLFLMKICESLKSSYKFIDNLEKTKKNSSIFRTDLHCFRTLKI